MKEAKVLLLDVGSESGMTTELRNLLSSSNNAQIRIRLESADAAQFPSFQNDFSSTLRELKPDLILLILPSKGSTQPPAWMETLTSCPEDRPVIVVTDGKAPQDVIRLLREGVVDFITPPLKAVDVLPRVWRSLEERERKGDLVQSLKKSIGLKQLIGKDPGFIAEMEKIPVVAKCDASVLILGETGTGKELCGRVIHYLSPRASKPFVPVNCGAIPTELVENELFGHAKGAFTGASRSYFGLINEADGGTLFLDEIDCLPLQAQVKFLRFLQNKEYKSLGSSKMVQADVRVIVASNIDLEEAVSNGRFRRDLFYRLNIISITLSPLQARREDIFFLARHFLEMYVLGFGKSVVDLTAEALQKLLTYEWPGNVRELENVIQRALVFSKESHIQGSDIVLPIVRNVLQQESFRKAKAESIARFEKRYIQNLLLAYQGNITKAAKAAQKNRRAFWELIRKYKVEVRNYKPRLLEKTG